MFIYFKWINRSTGEDFYTRQHPITPAPQNERWEIVEITKMEYDLAIARLNKEAEGLLNA